MKSKALKKSDVRASGQLDIKSEYQKCENLAPSIVIDGCTVSFTSTKKDTDETLMAVKEILLSAYGTKQVEG
ncbi:MAG: hypothetical protein M0R40_08880 [Firmicutes bacterium]|jgi:hypothetical protein|nr:hypothetical protein [Bacillota bacterium]